MSDQPKPIGENLMSGDVQRPSASSGGEAVSPSHPPKPTGQRVAVANEWTVEENDHGTTLNLHDGSGPISLPIGRPWFVFATIIADAHNAALAVVQRIADDSIVENVRLMNELAAERESKIIKPTGEYRAMRDDSSHARKTPVYTK